MADNKLKPCPCCGSEAQSITNHTQKYPYSFVICTLCGLATKNYIVNHEYLEISKEEAAIRAKQEATAAWNKRYYSWDILMEILDEHYPADIFCDLKDVGAQIVTKIREINALRNKAGNKRVTEVKK